MRLERDKIEVGTERNFVLESRRVGPPAERPSSRWCWKLCHRAQEIDTVVVDSMVLHGSRVETKNPRVNSPRPTPVWFVEFDDVLVLRVGIGHFPLAWFVFVPNVPTAVDRWNTRSIQSRNTDPVFDSYDNAVVT